MGRERRLPSHRRSLDRRLFLWVYLATAAIGVVEVIVAASRFERVAWVVLTIVMVSQAVKKWQDMRHRGRWMNPPNADAQASLRQRRRIMAVALPIIFLIGLVIGVS